MMQIKIFCNMTPCKLVRKCQSPEEKLPPFLTHFTRLGPYWRWRQRAAPNLP